MRQKRAKTYRKLMELYCHSFGFRQPYQVLIDSELCKAAIDMKIDFTKQLTRTLQGETKPMITQCCIHELYLQGKPQQPAVDLAKTFERRKCNHREPIPGDECLQSVVGEVNKHRYVIATQSQPLRVALRNIRAVPIVHINRSVMVLEPPSDTTIQAKQAAEEQALHPSLPELARVLPSTPAETPRVKRKGPKGPNPLSVKKKKVAGSVVKPQKEQVAARAGEKRMRGESEDEGGDQTNTAENYHSNSTKSFRRRKRRRKSHNVDSIESHNT